MIKCLEAVVGGMLIGIVVASVLALTSCATVDDSPAPATIEASTELYANEVLPNDAFFERFTGNGAELEGVDNDVACSHIGAVFYFPLERYAALWLANADVKRLYYGDMTFTTPPRIFVSNISGNEAHALARFCSVKLFVKPTQMEGA